MAFPHMASFRGGGGGESSSCLGGGGGGGEVEHFGGEASPALPPLDETLGEESVRA